MDATTRFFEGLAGAEQPLLRRVSGKLRFDIRRDGEVDRWLVELDSGKARAFHRGGRADVVMSAERRSFDRIVTGRANAMAAILRGALEVEGDIYLLAQLLRLFPGPPKPHPVQKSSP